MKNPLFIAQTEANVTCYDAAGQTVLILDQHDLKRMQLSDLEATNPDDVFTYANHLLGDSFNAWACISGWQGIQA